MAMLMLAVSVLLSGLLATLMYVFVMLFMLLVSVSALISHMQSPSIETRQFCGTRSTDTHRRVMHNAAIEIYV